MMRAFAVLLQIEQGPGKAEFIVSLRWPLEEKLVKLGGPKRKIILIQTVGENLVLGREATSKSLPFKSTSAHDLIVDPIAPLPHPPLIGGLHRNKQLTQPLGGLAESVRLTVGHIKSDFTL